MILYANGCSMTFGAELVPHNLEHEPKHIEYREYHSWPGQLGEIIGATKVVNEAIGGGSNDRIVRTALDYFSSLSDDEVSEYYVVIGWSGAIRTEFSPVNNTGQVQYIPYHINPRYDSIKQSFPKKVKDFVLLYERYACCEEHAYIKSNHLIIGLQNYLIMRGIRYLFFDALHHNGDIRQDTSMVDQRRFIDFTNPYSNMYRWIVENRYPQKPEGHPSETGHRAWAEYLHRYMQELGDI